MHRMHSNSSLPFFEILIIFSCVMSCNGNDKKNVTNKHTRPSFSVILRVKWGLYYTLLLIHVSTWLCVSSVIKKWSMWVYEWVSEWVSERGRLFNVTCNDISVIYVTAHRCTGGLKKKLNLRSGSQGHRHYVRFFNVPVQAPTRGHPFYTVIPRNRPI